MAHAEIAPEPARIRAASRSRSRTGAAPNRSNPNMARRAEAATGQRIVSRRGAQRCESGAAATAPRRSRRPQFACRGFCGALKRTQLLMIGGAALLVLFATVGAVLSKTVRACRCHAASAARDAIPSVTATRQSARAANTQWPEISGRPRCAGRRADRRDYWIGRAARQGEVLAQYELWQCSAAALASKADAGQMALRWYRAGGSTGQSQGDAQSCQRPMPKGWGAPQGFRAGRAAGSIAPPVSAMSIPPSISRCSMNAARAYRKAWPRHTNGMRSPRRGRQPSPRSRVDVLASQIAPDDLAAAQAARCGISNLLPHDPGAKSGAATDGRELKKKVPVYSGAQPLPNSSSAWLVGGGGPDRRRRVVSVIRTALILIVVLVVLGIVPIPIVVAAGRRGLAFGLAHALPSEIAFPDIGIIALRIAAIIPIIALATVLLVVVTFVVGPGP